MFAIAAPRKELALAKSRTDPPATAAFDGFTLGAFAFFEALTAEQNRDWFLANKETYEREVRRPLAALVEAVAFACEVRDLPFTGDAKRSLFRINRDIRFSNDKSPYKTNASAIWSRDGGKTSKGVLYFHLSGERAAFMAAGFYGLGPKDLGAVRAAVAGKPERWLAVETAVAASGLAPSRDGALTRLPKGYETADAAIAPTLKLRNFIVSRPIAIESLYRPALIDEIVDFAEQALPILKFGWSALG